MCLTLRLSQVSIRREKRGKGKGAMGCISVAPCLPKAFTVAYLSQPSWVVKAQWARLVGRLGLLQTKAPGNTVSRGFACVRFSEIRACRSPHSPAGCSLACWLYAAAVGLGRCPKPRQELRPCVLPRASPLTRFRCGEGSNSLSPTAHTAHSCCPWGKPALPALPSQCWQSRNCTPRSAKSWNRCSHPHTGRITRCC